MKRIVDLLDSKNVESVIFEDKHILTKSGNTLYYDSQKVEDMEFSDIEILYEKTKAELRDPGEEPNYLDPAQNDAIPSD